MEFNPRSLVYPYAFFPRGAGTAYGRPKSSGLDAIFIPTRGRAFYLIGLLQELQAIDAPVFILITEPSDVYSDFGLLPGNPEIVMLDVSEIPDIKLQVPDEVARVSDDWDLPKKRNYALWFSRIHGFNKILLVDDDIRDLSNELIHAASLALNDYAIVGPYIDEFPDLSLAGHAGLAVGRRVNTFLSGACLFINVPATRSIFPQIYNEDWLFMLPHIVVNSVANVGCVRQIPYDPFTKSNACFQEFGDIIADGLYWLLCNDLFQFRLKSDVWRGIISTRQSHLRELRGLVRDRKQRVSLCVALDFSSGIDESQCVAFLAGWEEALESRGGIAWPVFREEFACS